MKKKHYSNKEDNEIYNIIRKNNISNSAKLQSFAFTFIISFFLITGITGLYSQALVAFPSAEGFGKWAVGGRGGAIYFVNTLDDNRIGKKISEGIYEGSFRYACEAKGTRTVIFRVGGTIVVRNDLQTIKISNPYITIAGQTAPGDGIMLRCEDGVTEGETMEIKTHNVIIRHLRFRRGSGGNGDALKVGPWSKHCLLDHCSFSWSTDETMSVYGNQLNDGSVDSITVQWCFITEPLDMSTHDYKDSHGRGPSIGGGATRVTFFANYFAHSDYRMPHFATIKGSYATGDSYLLCQIVNNVIYNWRKAGTDCGNYIGENNIYATTYANIQNNFYKKGPDSPSSGIREICHQTGGKETKIFLSGNLGDSFRKDNDSDWIIGTWGDWKLSPEAKYRATNAFPFPIITSIMSASVIVNDVINKAGATKPRRDAVDIRVANDFVNSTGKIIDCVTNNPDESPLCDCEKNAGGWPEYKDGIVYPDIDFDGMDDEWEISFLGGNLEQNNNGDYNGDGYTNIENYINYLAGDYYILTVANGERSGLFLVGEQVVLTADVPAKNTVFDKWSGTNAETYVANISNATTIISMPLMDYTITATYKDAPKYSLTVTKGIGSSLYFEGEHVSVTANAPATGYEFSEWLGDTSYLADKKSITTILTMPAKNLSLVASYINSSFSNMNETQNIIVYPNPVYNFLNIEVQEKSKIEIMNDLGIVCYFFTSIEQSSQLNVSSLSTGLYFVRVTNINGVFITQFIKE